MMSLPALSSISHCATDGLCYHRATTCRVQNSKRRSTKTCKRSPIILEYHYLFLLRHIPSSCVLPAVTLSISRMSSTISRAAREKPTMVRDHQRPGVVQFGSLHLRLPLRPLRGGSSTRRARGAHQRLQGRSTCILLFRDSVLVHNRCTVLLPA